MNTRQHYSYGNISKISTKTSLACRTLKLTPIHYNTRNPERRVQSKEQSRKSTSNTKHSLCWNTIVINWNSSSSKMLAEAESRNTGWEWRLTQRQVQRLEKITRYLNWMGNVFSNVHLYSFLARIQLVTEIFNSRGLLTCQPLSKFVCDTPQQPKIHSLSLFGTETNDVRTSF